MKKILLLIQIIFSLNLYSQSHIDLNINEKGLVNAEIKLIKNKLASDCYLITPLKWNENSQINKATDVIVSPIAQNDRFTIFLIVNSPKDSLVEFSITNFGKLEETYEAKSQIKFDNIYSYLSQNEKELLNHEHLIDNYTINIHLPKKYEETSVNSKNLTTKDEEVFSCDAKTFLESNNKNTAWLVFPNPQSSKLKIALIIFTFLFSSFSLLFYVPALKERNIKWSLVVLFASIVLLVIAYYFSTQYPKGLEFVLGISGTIPHVLYGIISSIYLLITKYFGIRVFGKITLNGAETKLVEITLLKKVNNSFVPLKKLHEIRNDGSYSFNLLVWNKTSIEYKIETSHRVANDYSSSSFTLKRGDKHEELINLTT